MNQKQRIQKKNPSKIKNSEMRIKDAKIAHFKNINEDSIEKSRE